MILAITLLVTVAENLVKSMVLELTDKSYDGGRDKSCGEGIL